MTTHPRDLRIEDFAYELPESRIPLFPPAHRGGSMLLTYHQGHIAHDAFNTLPEALPKHSLLVFNQSKVIPARLIMRRDSGALIEIFLLQPLDLDHQSSLAATGQCKWSCLVGGAKKWKDGEALHAHMPEIGHLRAFKEERKESYFTVRFEWDKPSVTFGEVLERIGKIPLPPYLRRETTAEDEDRYQTVYALASGSVAAPTAGLHFTNDVIHTLQTKGHQLAYLTLHVGAGTFRPVAADRMADHHMHTEYFVLSLDLIAQLLSEPGRPVIPVGTTSMRTLESLYWLGVQCANDAELTNFHVPQWSPYQEAEPMDTERALNALARRMSAMQMTQCRASTAILIAPGYQFRICKGLITNFHQPHSTLLLLVAAFLGEHWRQVYDYALANEFRFLSYGDSSLLLPSIQTG